MNAALLGKRASPQLLISVCTLDEAKMALELGADIIDMKNPHSGALGALPLADTRSIVAFLNHQPMGPKGITSPTLGECPIRPQTVLQN